jgi:integrase
MASISRDKRFPKGVWYANYTLASGQRVMRSTCTRNKAEAKVICEAWSQAEHEAAIGTLSSTRAAEIINETLARLGQEPITRYRLGSWLDEWLQTKRNLSDHLQKRYRFAVRIFLEFLGSGSERRFLDSITESDVRRFADHLASQGRAATTVNRVIRNDLGGAFNKAVKLGKIRFSPIASTEPEKDQGRIGVRRTFTVEEIARLVKAAQGTDWQGAILFAYSSGARLSDVANLRWDSIDLVAGVITYHQRKTRRQSVVAIHPDLQNWLDRQPALDRSIDFVFPELAGRPVGGKSGLTNRFNKLVEQVGIATGLIREARGSHGRARKALSFHSLRHGAASSVFNSAIAQEAARRVTGHAAGGSLDKYLHLDLEAIRAASSLIPRLPTID